MRRFFLTEEQFKYIVDTLSLNENNNREGINFKTNDQGQEVAYYTPEKFNKGFDTHVLQTGEGGEKEIRYTVKYLPKTKVKSINLFSRLLPKFSKLMKHGVNLRGEKVIQDQSMKQLYNKIIFSLYNIVKKEMPDVDYILSPMSSSNLNTTICSELDKRLGGDVQYKIFVPNMLIKDVQGISIDDEWLKNKADNIDKLTDDEYNTLLNQIKKWKTIDEPIRGLRRNIEQLEKEIEEIKALKQEKRGRPSKEITSRQQQIKGNEEAIAALRHGGGAKGKDPTIGTNNKVRDWEIKSKEDKVRKALIGFMRLNPEKQSYISKFKGKKIILFDDNISSGATLDDCCIALQKAGVKTNDILVLTIGVMDPTVYQRSARTDSEVGY